MATTIALLFLLQVSSVQPTVQEHQPAARVDTVEVALLRAQIAEARSFRTDILQTVNSTLTTVAGLVVLLVGFSWFSNFRVLEREKSALQAELRNLVANEQLLANKELRAAISSEAGHLRTAAQESLNAGLKKFELKLSSSGDTINLLGNRIGEVELRQSYNHALAEAWYWEHKKVEGNELQYYLDALGLAIELNDQGAMGTVLARIIALGDKGTLPFWSYVPRITSHLEQLPSHFSAEKQRVTELLGKVKRT